MFSYRTNIYCVRALRTFIHPREYFIGNSIKNTAHSENITFSCANARYVASVYILQDFMHFAKIQAHRRKQCA